MSAQTYRLLADATFCFHWVWVVIIVVGGIVSAFVEAYRVTHLCFVFMTISAQILFLGCPLVSLETYLRRQYGDDSNFSGSFVCFCLERYMGVTMEPIYVAAALIVIAALSVALVIWNN